MESKNELYPVFIKLSSLRLLLVGGGNVALEKLNSIITNSPKANILVIAPAIKTEIVDIASNHLSVKIVYKKFEDQDITEMDLIICATDDKNLHTHIKSLAKKLNTLVNVADTPELCDFYLSSIVQKGNLKLAISTNGLSPTGAKRIKEILQDALPDTLDDVLRKLNSIRNNLKGDFEYKVKKMNEVTSLFALNHNAIKRLKIESWVSKTITIILSILFGYLIAKYL